MKTETEIKKLSIEKYEITMFLRGETKSFPNHPYLVEFKRLTPKAKYSKCKIVWRYVYKTEPEAIEKLFSTFNNLESNINKNNERKEKARQANAEVKASDFYKIGDVICNSWGYEQTNIDFYQVVKVGNKTIEIKKIRAAMVENSMYSHGMACEVMPSLDDFINDGKEYTLRVKADGCLSNPASFYYMHKWSGKPKYCSWYA